MNERLRELYRQAHGTRHYDGDPALDGNPPTVYWQGEVSAERFARLIIRECIRIDVENPDAAPGVEIAKYFGVDEQS